jgi:peptide/nickel transport system substrate-binding protein
MVPFAMVSPDAVKKYKANDIKGSSESPNLATPFGTEHPVGTGPYSLTKWERGQQITLKANPDYWGKKPEVKSVAIQSLTDSTAKFQAFQSGSIGGYQNVPASDVSQLKKSDSAKLYTADPYTVGYAGFNQMSGPFKNPKLREAVTHALDRKTLVKSMFDKGSLEANQLVPSATAGYTKDLPDQDYNPELAKKILKDNGLEGTTIEFAYPSGVSRSYMPNPSNIFQAFQKNLEDVGLKVKPVEIPWGQYSSKLLGGELDMYLWGSVGSYPSAAYFLNLYTSQTKLAPKLSKKVQKLLVEADNQQDQQKQTETYEQVSKLLMDDYVAVPYVEPASTTVLSKRYGGFVPSPYGEIDFAKLTLKD